MSFPQPAPPLMEEKENYLQKGLRKCKEQPFVPVGVLLTCIAFLGATRSLRAGDQTSFNRYLRFRVLAQGLTIAGCVAGAYYIGQEAREEGKRKQLDAAGRGEVSVRPGKFDEGLRGRMREAERVAVLEREADGRLATATAVTAASRVSAPAAGAGEEGKTSAEVNAALARARGAPEGKKSKEVAQEPMRIGDLLSATELRERLERRGRAALGKGEKPEGEDEEKKV